MKPTHPHGFNASLTDYLREVYCVCPSCSSPAVIRANSQYAFQWVPTEVKFTCTHCPFRIDWPSPQWVSRFDAYNPSDAVEPYFGLSLLAVEQVAGHTLAVLSPSHADDLAHFVRSRHRPRPKNSKWAMVNRLPTWVKLSRNRAKVLRAISNARQKFTLRPNNAMYSDTEPHSIKWTPRPNGRGGSNGSAGGS
jgi:hypothetical protein